MASPADNTSGDSHRSARRTHVRLSGSRKVWVVGLAALLVVAWAGHWVYQRWTHVYIDDARIDGEVITISSRVSGWITELPVIQGAEVKKGQLLAQIDDRDSRLQKEVLLSKLKAIENQMAVVQAQSGQVDQETLGRYQSETNRLAAAEAEVAAIETQVKQARDDLKRAQDLAEAKGLSPQALDRARTTYNEVQERHRKATSEVAAVRGTLSAAGGSRRQLKVMERQVLVLVHQADEIRAEIRRQDVDIADRTIVSPADGRVVMTFARKGEHVSSGRLLMFHDPNEIWIDVTSRKPASACSSQQADIHVDAYPDKVFGVFRIGSCYEQVRTAARSQSQRQLHQDYPASAIAPSPGRERSRAAPRHDGRGFHCHPRPLRSCSRATARVTAGSPPAR
jgi:membrane fusion protein (multidrug efflux system)